MKRNIWLICLLAGALGWSGTLSASQTQPPQDQEETYPAENAEIVAQPGPADEQEGVNQEEPEGSVVEEDQDPESGEAGVSASASVVLSQPAAPARGYVWIAPFRMACGVVVPGFWRPRVMAGFVWVNSRLVNGGYYVPGFWRPMRVVRQGYSWVPGFWFGLRWHPGFWRPAARPGFVWVYAHWNPAGQWVNGYWRPLGPAPRGRLWVPGFYHRGSYTPGYWRGVNRPGAAWIVGHYDPRGLWVTPHWRVAQAMRRGIVRGHVIREERRMDRRMDRREDRRELRRERPGRGEQGGRHDHNDRDQGQGDHSR